MIGAIAGDIIGSVYERRRIKTKDFPLFDVRCSFTDDTVLTVSVADAILSGAPYLDSVRRIGRRHPGAGYGGSFIRWLFAEDTRPYNSWGNGSAMRVSPDGIRAKVKDLLTPDLWEVTDAFCAKYIEKSRTDGCI